MTALLLLTCLAAVEPAPPAPPLTMPVVTGWRRLLDQPPIRLRDPPLLGADGDHVARVGISAATAAIGDTVVVYVAAPAAAGFSGYGDPLEIRILPPTERALPAVNRAPASRASSPRGGVHLFGTVIPIDEAGTWRIQAFDRETEVATATVAVSGRSDHPWRTVRAIGTSTVVPEPPGVLLAIACGPGTTATITAPDDEPWFHLPETGRLALRQPDAPDLPLPTAEPAPTATLRWDRGWLVIDLPEGCDAQLEPLETQLLARWWRDGLPWQPSPEAEAVAVAESDELWASTAADAAMRRLRLPVAWSDVPPGTPLAVEFLWSSAGVIRIGQEMDLRDAAQQAWSDDQRPRVVVARTNRLEFRAP